MEIENLLETKQRQDGTKYKKLVAKNIRKKMSQVRRNTSKREMSEKMVEAITVQEKCQGGGDEIPNK